MDGFIIGLEKNPYKDFDRKNSANLEEDIFLKNSPSEDNHVEHDYKENKEVQKQNLIYLHDYVYLNEKIKNLNK